MINLIDGYGIKVSSNCYTIGKQSMRTNKETNKQTEVFTELGYYPTVQSALKGVRKHLHRDVLVDFEGSLSEAIKAISEMEDRFNALLEQVEF